MIRVTRHLLVSALFTMMVVAACATTAGAQGSRKDDVVFNAQGRPMAGASVRVCTSEATGQPCTPLALIYSDAALTQALANPLSADGLGNYNFYAAPGRYEIEISGPGIVTKQIPNVILPSDPTTPTFTSVTTTIGISAFSLSLTGNLTVSGSTAVTGSLTVGGAPVPSTSGDNQWTAGQRFKGPIPWRDVSTYMPAGGCSSANVTDPDTTGSITSGTTTLTLTAAADFKNGCGITVLGAGATSTLVMPGSCTASVSVAANVATATCGAAHNLNIQNPGGLTEGILITGCTDGTFNGGQVGIQTIPTTTTLTYNFTHANGSTTGFLVSFVVGWAHGAVGSTTYYYKFSACDSGGGCSTAVGPVTITNGNATLTADNYNWLGWSFLNNSTGIAKFVCVYRSPDNITYAAKGTSFTYGFTDRGFTYPVHPDCPATPPASPTAKQLVTTIVSGAGTTSLVLAAAASNTATSQNVYHDETSFLTSCINDAQTDQGVGVAGTHGCLIPAGNYHFNSDPATDRSGGAWGTAIYVDGTVTIQTWPWMFSGINWYLKGQGWSGGASAGGRYPGAAITVGTKVESGLLVQSCSTSIHNLILGNVNGNGLEFSQGVGSLTVICDLDFGEIDIANSNAVGSPGVPLVFDQNALFVKGENLVLIPNQTGIPASILFTTSPYNASITWCCMEFDNIFTDWHGLLFESPGGNGNGRGAPIGFNHWESEVHGLFPTGGLITIDTGFSGSTPGAGVPGPNVPQLKITQMDNADALNINNGGVLLFYKGNLGSADPTILLSQTQAGFSPLVRCSTSMGTNGCLSTPDITTDTIQVLGGVQQNYTGVGTSMAGGPEYVILHPLVTGGTYGTYGAVPPAPAWADSLPAPRTLVVTGTGTGSLAAATYCMVVVGIDSQVGANKGLTLASPEVCQTVGASSSINLSWGLMQSVANSGFMYSDYYLFYGTGGPGTEGNYVDTAIAPQFSATVNYTFTSTAGNVARAVPAIPTAYLSWLYRNTGTNGCFYCYAGANNNGQLGIGEPNPGAGVKLAVLGGTIQGEGGIQAGSDTAFNASPRGAYNAFLPNLTSAAATYQRMTLDKAITVTRLQLVLGTAGAGCTTQSTVSVTDGTSSVTLTTANGTALYDSGAVSQNFAAAANLDIKIATAASGCTTAPQNANVTAQYRMQ